MHMPLKAVLWGHRRRFIPNPSKGSSHSWFQAVRRPFPAVSGFAHAGRGWNASNPAAAIRQSFRPAFPPLRNQQGRPEGERGGTTRPPRAEPVVACHHCPHATPHRRSLLASR